MAIGMKVMVTQNIVTTDLDITNGARGTIVNIWLHPEEPPISDLQPKIELKYLPLCVLVKLDHTRTSQLTGLEECVIPVEPVTQPYRISYQSSEGNALTRTVRRRQFPMTAAYAFTDYRSQGQTLPAMIVDIATPPTGKYNIFSMNPNSSFPGGLSLFNLYVALSRSSGQSTIRILRDFDEKIFQTPQCPELLIENERIEALNGETLIQWKRSGRDSRKETGS